jgi:hypothetical protein
MVSEPRGGVALARQGGGQRGAVVTGLSMFCGLVMVIFGLWAELLPSSFATMIKFPPYNAHLVHDVGAFQIGIGVTVLLALTRLDALTVALAGFLVAGVIHAVNHAMDRSLGGHGADAWALGGLVMLAGIALVLHLRSWRSRRSDRDPS